MKSIKYLLCFLSFLPATALAWQWADLWQNPDQQGSKLLQAGKPQVAARVFHDKNWQSVSYYRAGNYEQAFKQFSANKTSDGQYNAGNAAAFMGNYPEAIAAYDKALALNSNNNDALINRDIVKKLLQKKQQQENQQQQNKQQPDNSASNNKNDKSKSTTQQNQTGKQNQPQQNDQKNSQPDNKQQSANNTTQNQPENSSQKSAKEPPHNNAQTTASNKQQKQDEANKQLLRQLPDDPGGLLQQKFLRDYARRHSTEDNLNQGAN